MSTVYFFYGTVMSAKTLAVISVLSTYDMQHKRTILAKPAVDTRDGRYTVRSRGGGERKVDLLIGAGEFKIDCTGIDVVVVDEAQFLTAAQVDYLCTLPVPVMCYGLRTDSNTRLFEGARRLMEVAHKIREVKTTCITAGCAKKAVYSLKHVDGKKITGGPSVDLGGEEKYVPVCYRHYMLWPTE